MFKRIITHTIRYQFLISMASVAFYWSGFILYAVPRKTGSLRNSVFVFCATFLAYNLPLITRYVQSPGGHEFFIGFYILIMALIFYISLAFGMIKFFYLLHLGVIAFFYNFPFKTNQWTFLPARTIPFLKILLIAYVWSSIGSIFPLFTSGTEPSAHFIGAVFCIQFLFISAITLPFDIRDYRQDINHQIKTFPGYFGIRITRITAMVLALSYILASSLTLHTALPFIIIGFIMMLLIYHSGERRSEFYYTGIIDGFIMIYWAILSLFSYLGMI